MSVVSRLRSLHIGGVRTIRFRIISLLAILLVPLLGVFIWLALSYAGAKKQLIEQNRLDITNKVSAEIDREVAVPMGILVGLAGADDITKGQLDEFRHQAAKLSTNPLIDRIWAFDRSGNAIVGSRPDRSADDARLDGPEMMAKVFAGNRFVSSVRGEGVKNAKVVIAVPVSDARGVIYGIAAEIRVEQLSAKFASAGMEQQWVAAVVDYNGRYVARSLDAERRVGQAARPELVEAARNRNATGVFENVTYEGANMLNSYHRSYFTGWTTVVAVPKRELAAPYYQATALVVLGGAGIVLATLGIAWSMSERISEPIRHLSKFASALAGGKTYTEPSHNIAELVEVREALERAMAHSARLAALVASSGDAIMSIDLDGTIRTWNNGAEDLFGYKAEEIVGQQKTLIVPAERREEFEEQRARIMAGEAIRTETVRKKKSGEIVHVSLNSAPIRRPDGRVFAISSIIHDISDRKADEEHKLFLLRELAHRSKNQLAIIQSIAGRQRGGQAPLTTS